ncbi:FliD family flagellar hook-associated protein [Wigglesworthia glossinidia endosymbiont of Glossina morsitans morsitans (Yale colony)]|uniref:Flagellar hook-associated protein 2 n=1 Tax=Wigglesworthia glossinidia endosymbiont of Glossina morsitans morsitans (Yale colony) TaxID=1142511 RepID=H6Q5M3_WIGGL|nr:flagellar filament capping protein FliD [Wigglesworthia glossinidia]AFA40927.1 FliD family flagellar hook-associated protein [Wigglesworthia glossinidia endosymbiont of Glossina morsitans morsitans (Yale colony)]
MTNISMLGIGSKGATSELMQRLIEIENLKLKPLQNEKEIIKNKISAWGKICYSLQNILQKSSTINSRSFSSFQSSKNECFSTSGGQSESSHEVSVVQLAKNHTLSLFLKQKKNTILGNSENIRYLNIVQGNKQNQTNKKVRIKLNRNNTTLENISKAINKSNLNIHSEIKKINFNENCLLISSDILGTNGQLAINVDGDDKLDQILRFPNKNVENLEKNQNETTYTQMRENQKAQCSILEVDGIKYYRESNIITDALKNVTFNLIKTSKKDESKKFFEKETVRFFKDKNFVLKNIKEFVTCFNTFIDQTSEFRKLKLENSHNSYLNKQSKDHMTQSSILFGNSLLTNLISKLRQCTRINYCDYKQTNITSLIDVGIAIDQKSGKLILNQEKLNSNTEKNWLNMQDFFLGKKNQIGFISNISQLIQEYINNTKLNKSGIIESELQDLKLKNKAVIKNINRTETMIRNRINLYQLQFQKLDVFLTKTDAISKQIDIILSSHKT